MGKANYISLSGNVLKFDKSKLNKEVIYPVIKAGYLRAQSAATIQRNTGELLKNLKTVSINKRNSKQIGYILFAGKRIDYSDRTPHFVTFYKYQNGKVYKAIKRVVRSELKKLN